MSPILLRAWASQLTNLRHMPCVDYSLLVFVIFGYSMYSTGGTLWSCLYGGYGNVHSSSISIARLVSKQLCLMFCHLCNQDVWLGDDISVPLCCWI